MNRKAKFHEDSAGQRLPIAKSCEDNIGEDPIKSDAQQYDPLPPRPKSYKTGSEDEWDELSGSERKDKNIKPLVAEQQKPGKEDRQPTFKHENRNDKRFTDDILESQSVEDSAFQSSSQEQLLINGNSVRNEIPKTTLPKKRQFFNLLLVGAASTGKTTYMECFLKKYKQNNQSIIKENTQQITEVKSPPLSFNLSLDFSIIDTPGYTHSSIGNYCKMIQQQIRSRIQKTRRNRQNMRQGPDSRPKNEENEVQEAQNIDKWKEDVQPRDQRIHCCLFFFRGPRLHSDDWKLLEQLHDKCNIIPVIAKGDCYTIQQILQLKKCIVTKAAERKIRWFDIQQFIRQKYPEELNSITQGLYGISPPFMIACSTTKIERGNDIRIGRQYKWGTCYVDDEKHTQFATLNRLLIRCLYKGLVTKLDLMEGPQKAKIEKQNVDKLKGFIGIGLTVVVLAYLAKKMGHHESMKN